MKDHKGGLLEYVVGRWSLSDRRSQRFLQRLTNPTETLRACSTETKKMVGETNRSLAIYKLMTLLLALSLLSCNLPAQIRKNVLRPSELLDGANTYLNHSVEVEIVEPLYGPATIEQLNKAEYGQVEVRIPEGASGRLSLVPQSFKVTDPNRYRHKFDQVIASPVKVAGEFLKDEEMSAAERRPVFVLRVSSIEPVHLGQPEKVRSLRDIESDPARWDRKLIIYEGVYQTGFEVSSLDGEIWLEAAPQARINNPSNSGARANKVRVTGILFSKPGARYGHLGGSKYQLVATKLEYLSAVH